jgi:hypothetical protein
MSPVSRDQIVIGFFDSGAVSEKKQLETVGTNT